ncbi:adenosylcobinamide-GDP ribazoletransferase [Desulfovirgula thermocuniculi]|uniref:adenosylcobinamide-GDP ribazoletransferase n=1 Tax=Desulfovirgula thermocuniculi TaxID=348842 RepID=UPI001B7FA544|nr:adenosylcobinamide-GDP ribazoletransferase [Desulfovirgula thermocuniculi]
MKAFLHALHFLTRLGFWKVEFDRQAFGRAPVFFPLVGFLLGAIWLGLARFFLLLFPEAVVAALLVAAMVFLTGGLHLDGFMDTVDGVFSGRPREQMLEIMRDSRVGAFGVIALTCLLLLKYAVILALLQKEKHFPLLVVPALSRWGMVYALASFPSARREGLGYWQASCTGKKELFLATCWALGAAVAAGPPGLALFPAAWIAVHGMARYLSRRLGGLTGDTYGFLNEALEVFLLYGTYPLSLLLPEVLR